MLNDLDLQLERERLLGGQHKTTWDTFVKPFFNAKNEQLFEAFQQADSKDVQNLQLIKLQSNVLKSMEIHFMHFINTGKLAEIQLTRKEGEQNGN